MLVTVKILQGRECTIEVSAATPVHNVKELVARELDIPANQQKLIFRGKTLIDEQCLRDYNIVDGTKLHLFIRQEDINSNDSNSGIFWNELSTFLQKHFTAADANKIMQQFKKEYETSLDSCSLDDLERIAETNLCDHSSLCA